MDSKGKLFEGLSLSAAIGKELSINSFLCLPSVDVGSCCFSD